MCATPFLFWWISHFGNFGGSTSLKKTDAAPATGPRENTWSAKTAACLFVLPTKGSPLKTETPFFRVAWTPKNHSLAPGTFFFSPVVPRPSLELLPFPLGPPQRLVSFRLRAPGRRLFFGCVGTPEKPTQNCLPHPPNSCRVPTHSKTTFMWLLSSFEGAPLLVVLKCIQEAHPCAIVWA